MSRIFCGDFIRAVLEKHGLSETGNNNAKFIEPSHPDSVKYLEITPSHPMRHTQRMFRIKWYSIIEISLVK